MKTLNRQAKLGACGSKLLTALAFAAAINLAPVTSAFADHGRGDERGERHENHGYRGGGYGGGYGGGGYGGGGYGYGGYGGYGYSQPIYVPPPVYYPPQQSPGINLMLPFSFHIR